MATVLFWQKPAFRYPVSKAARTAVLAPWFRSTGMARVFPDGWSAETARFGPEAVAGTREQLLGLDPSVKLTHALIALARPGGALLTNAERDLLWRRFGVPVFEQIVAEDGELVAAECGAHDGLHIAGSRRDWKGYKIESAPCGCGLKTPRLFAAESATFAAVS